MLIREYTTIPALTGDRQRRVFYYLPNDYDDSDERYPVLYMFDGHNLFDDGEATFGRSWRLADYLDAAGKKVIVAAVECNHDGNMRLSEYSPVSFDFRGEHIVGRGKKYMDWLTGVFKPSVDANLRTMPQREHTFIGGSSMGGLMSLYAVTKYNRIFSGAAALSPSLWVQGDGVLSFVRSARLAKGTVIFTDYGTKEFRNHAPQTELFYRTVEVLGGKGATVTARVVEGGTHCEQAWEREIPHFMCALGL